MNAPLETARFEEAVGWFRRHLPDLREADFAELLQVTGGSSRRWTVKAQLDLVTQVWTGIDAALANGETLADFKARMFDAVRRAWGSEALASEHRIETIFRNNVQRAYNAGRLEELRRPEVLESHPLWAFSAIKDMRTSRICLACAGTVLPANHPWWRNHQPPLHHRCRSNIVPLTEESAKRRGGVTRRPTKTEADEGFGNLEVEPEWKPRKKDGYPAPLIAAWEARVSHAAKSRK